ncbi:transcriptional regulator [Lachnospiraceae bacterium JC7]|nr:transcriptional regulator [Lachnospiraceae bacterium JC7]
MKTSKEDILLTALKLFSERGFDAVSTSMIAEKLDITKGALYRHYKDKQAIFDSIIEKMYELDRERAEKDSVPASAYDESPEEYGNTDLKDFCEFTVNQFDFWSGDEFASAFRKMLILEQFKSPEKMKLYQDMIVMGPVKYSEDLFEEMIGKNILNQKAKKIGARRLAMELFASLSLALQLDDGGEDRERIKEDLKIMINEFRNRYSA